MLSTQTPSDQTASRRRLRYTGHTMLDNLGLVHMHGRVYDPTLGRFLSADPLADGLGSATGFNRYAYVGNNPLAYVDPFGWAGCAVRSGVAGCLHQSGDVDWFGRREPGPVGWLPDTVVSADRVRVPEPILDPFNDRFSWEPPVVFDRELVDTGSEAGEETGPNELLQGGVCSAKNVVAGLAGGAVAGGTAALLSGNLQGVPAALATGAIIGAVVGVVADQPGIVGFVAGGIAGVVVHSTSGGSFGDVLGAASGAAVPAGALSVPAGAAIGAFTGALPGSAALRAMPTLGRLGGAVVGSTAGAKAAALELAAVAIVMEIFDSRLGCGN